MINLLIGLLIIVVIELIIGFVFFKLFGNPLSSRVLVGILVMSFCLTLIPLLYFEAFSKDSISLKDSWRQVEKTGQQNTSFEYIEGVGLFAYKSDSSRKISGPVPECYPTGKITSLNPNRIEITTEPIAPLPPFPSDVKDQITFNMYYSSKPDVFATSSFVMENSKGYLWCVEDSYGMGFTLTYPRVYLYFFSYLFFIGSIILFSILALILLFIIKRRFKDLYQRISS